MIARQWKLVLLSLLALAAVAVLAIRQARAEPFFFLPGPEPVQVRPIVDAGPGGLAVYLQLLAPGGRDTRADGRAELVISDSRGVLYHTSRRIRSAEFAQVRFTGAQGWYWVRVYGFGWLGYETKMYRPPVGPGRVLIRFTTASGKVLRGSAAIPG